MSKSSDKELLSSFMKKAAQNKVQSKESAKNQSADKVVNPELLSEEEKQEQKEKEELEEAKKESRNKALQMDQTEMIKKLIIENTFKYCMMILVLVTFSLAVIKLGPAIVKAGNGFLYKGLMSALGSK